MSQQEKTLEENVMQASSLTVWIFSLTFLRNAHPASVFIPIDEKFIIYSDGYLHVQTVLIV